eukprot:gene12256-3607_t
MAAPELRTRKGEKFSNVDEVELYSSDFSYTELVGETEELIFSAPNELVETIDQERLEKMQSDNWERLYAQSKQNHYPIKNYILRAFPCLMEAL